MPIQNLGEIVTTTLRSRTKKLADNISHSNALLTRLNTKGKIKNWTGGSQILQELVYALNGTAMFYAGYEPLDITPQRIIDSATFDPKQAAVCVSMSGLEMLKNSGEEQILDLLESRIEGAEISMENLISTAIYSDGTAYAGKQIGGLQTLVSKTPTSGTVGGFDRSNSSNAFWRNIATTFTSLGYTAGADTIQSAMNAIWVQLVRGKQRPDLIVADNVYWRYYLESLQNLVRIESQNSDVAKLGFTSLKYQTADMILDGGVDGDCPASTMYFLNTNYLFYRPHAERNMVVDEKERTSVNQDALVKVILFAGNMTASNLRMQGVLSA